MMCRTRLIRRFPALDRRWRCWSPEDASIGAVPFQEAKCPALDADGNTVFWRDGKLLTIDSDLQTRVLFAQEDTRAVMSKVLLLDHGQVIFALDDELLTFRNIGIGALDTGPWPCADGNIQGNPAALR
jgi:hypothetical protein